MFNNNELKSLDVLLKRVNLTGEEALPVAELQLKIRKLISEETQTLNPQTTGNPETPVSETTGTE